MALRVLRPMATLSWVRRRSLPAFMSLQALMLLALRLEVALGRRWPSGLREVNLLLIFGPSISAALANLIPRSNGFVSAPMKCTASTTPWRGRMRNISPVDPSAVPLYMKNLKPRAHALEKNSAGSGQTGLRPRV